MKPFEFIYPGLLSYKRVKRGRYGQTYDPNAGDKAALAQFAMARGAKQDMFKGVPVHLTVSVQRKKSVTKRPDADNYAKLVMDALSFMLGGDDAAVSSLCVAKVRNAGPNCMLIRIEIDSQALEGEQFWEASRGRKKKNV